MKSPIYVTQDSAGSSRWVPLDYKQVPFNVGLGVKLSTGAGLTYTVEHTFDDIQNPDITPVAFPNAGLTSKTANDDGNYAFPVKAVRVTVSGYTSGNATLMIVQGEQR
jgi:hypothetical protein